MSRLNCYVYLTDSGGAVHAFGPDSAVPDWARKKITNPHVWAEAVEDYSWEPATTVTVASDLGGGGHSTTPAPAAAPSQDGPPPQGGAGASRQKWADYAGPLLAEQGVQIEADWKREDIIAACEKAGVPV